MSNDSEQTNQNSRAVLDVDMETVNYYPAPPPPYSISETTLTTQPVNQSKPLTLPPLKQQKPTYFDCHICQATVLTKVEHVNTRKTHLLAGFICGFTLWCLLCGFAAIPYIVPAFKNTKHYCPSCNTLLGSYSKC